MTKTKAGKSESKRNQREWIIINRWLSPMNLKSLQHPPHDRENKAASQGDTIYMIVIIHHLLHHACMDDRLACASDATIYR